MSSPRYWLMMMVLFAAAVGLYGMGHGEKIPLRENLKAMPPEVAGWHSQDIALAPRIIQAAGVDDYLNRLYTRPSSYLYLYVGYYQTQRTGDTIHSPKNCLPGSGWQPVKAGRTMIRTPEGHLAEVNEYVVEKGMDRQLVLYWYQSHGRIIASEYWAKVFMVLDAIRLNRTDAALVRVSMPFRQDEKEARSQVVGFSEQLLPTLDQILPR